MIVLVLIGGFPREVAFSLVVDAAVVVAELIDLEVVV